MILSKLEKDMNNRARTLEKEEEQTSYLLELMAYSQRTGATLDHLIDSSRKLFQILQSLKEGKIDPELLKKYLLVQISDIIQPISTSSVSSAADVE